MDGDPQTTGIEDVEWLDAKVVELSDANSNLRACLRVMAALMENDIAVYSIPLTETRKNVLKQASEKGHQDAD